MPYDVQHMKYKNFTWEFNPEKCTYSIDKNVIKHQYPEQKGGDMEDLSHGGAILTGSGEFFGPNAYKQWDSLLAEFNKRGPGYFYHPMFKDITKAIIKKLDASLEPRKNYIAYTFEIWQYLPPIITVTKIVITPPGGSSGSFSYGTLSNGSSGDWVVKLQNILINDLGASCLPVYGADGKFGNETASAVRKYQSKYGLLVDGIAGPQTLGKMNLRYPSGSSSSSSSGGNTITVKSGDTLWRLFGSNWQAIATLNGLKDPNSLYIGQVLRTS